MDTFVRAQQRVRAPDKIRDTHRAFTMRLPPRLYNALHAEADKNLRSVAAQMELIIQERYKDVK